MISFHWNSLKFFLSSSPGWSSSFIKLLYALILASVFIDMWGFIGGSIMLDRNGLSRKKRIERKEDRRLCAWESFFPFSSSRLRLKRLSVSSIFCCFFFKIKKKIKLSCMWWTHKRGIDFFCASLWRLWCINSTPVDMPIFENVKEL